MEAYLDLVKEILDRGESKDNRTGMKALTIPGAMLRHDMALGFPLLTTKKMAYQSVRVELEFFIKGLSDKRWLRERGCTIWDEWCNPRKIPPHLGKKERMDFQKEETDLGPIYGVQWRSFGNRDTAVDQLKKVVDTLKKNPSDRRMLVSAWNPCVMDEMAIPPCHVLFHLVVIGGRLSLTWFQRSCDLMLGVPFNLASYATLLHLLCLESRLETGWVTGMLSDVHIYENHLKGAREQIERTPYQLPRIVTTGFSSIFDWSYDQTKIENYQSGSPISFEVAV